MQETPVAVEIEEVDGVVKGTQIKESAPLPDKPLNPVRKYINVIGSVGVMLLFMGGVGYFNFHENQIMNRNANHIDVAGYASDGFYQLSLNMQYLDNDYIADAGQSELSKKTIKKLRDERDNIDTLLNLLKNGGTFNKEGEYITIEPITNKDKMYPTLVEIDNIWKNYRNHIEFLDKPEMDVTALAGLSNFGRINQPKAYETLDVIISGLTLDNIERKNMINNVLLGSVIFFLFYFLLFVHFVIRRLGKSDEQIASSLQTIQEANKELSKQNETIAKAHNEIAENLIHLEQARKETRDILDTVHSGLFLLEKDRTIKHEYSKELETLFGRTNIGGQRFDEILQQIIEDGEMIGTTFEYIKLLYDTFIIENQVASLNPLTQVACFIPDIKTNVPSRRYLSFKFNQVWNSDRTEVDRINVSVNDVTEAVELQQQVEKEKSLNALQLQMFEKISSLPSDRVAEYIESLTAKTNEINDILEDKRHTSEAFLEKANTIFKIAHTIKGESSLMGIQVMVNLANDMEEKLNTLRKKVILVGDDFMVLIPLLNNMIKLSHTLKQMSLATNYQLENEVSIDDFVKMGDSKKSVIIEKPEIVADDTSFEKMLHDYIYERSTFHNKQVKLEVRGLQKYLDTLSKQHYNELKDILIQLVRNSIVHGIESTATRFAENKPTYGTISIDVREMEENGKPFVQLVYSDDGHGIDINAIRERAIREKIITPEQGAKMSSIEIGALIFHEGLSTSNSINSDAGRGMGMNIIRDNVKKMGGVLKIGSRFRGGTKFIMKFNKQGQQ